MSSSPFGSLVELPVGRFGALLRIVPDSPWTTTPLQAIQNRKASVYVDSVDEPQNLIVRVRGGNEPGDHDQAYIYGSPTLEGLRAFVSSVTRATEFVADEELTPMILELHPAAVQREAIACWFEGLELRAPAPAPDSVAVRRLRVTDAEALQRLVPAWAFRTFDSPKDMIVGGACYGVEEDGALVSVAYVADQSIKYARIASVTAAPYRRRGHALAATRKLMEHVAGDGRLLCALVPRRNAPSVHFSLKLGFPQKALLRTYKVRPPSDAPPTTTEIVMSSAESTSSSAQTQG
jgi:RimJ/RimL family protein N-acetyltransferase